MDIIAITISVNYSDILQHILNQNLKFLKKWIIVTTTSDTKTIKLLEDYKDILDILIYDNFYTNNYKFNKGGAIKFAQDYVDLNYTDSNILLIDSDIYLPDNFTEYLPETLNPNTLYGVSGRYDFWSLHDFIKNINPHEYKHGNNFVGFFQLYKQNSIYKYKDSYNCAICDEIFKELFKKKIHLSMFVKHLGKDEVNWNGRTLIE